MNKQRGIVWAPLLIIIGVIVVAGIVTYAVIQTNSTNRSENTNAINVAVVNQSNVNGAVNRNTNSSANVNLGVNNNATSNINDTTSTNATVNTNSTANINAPTNTNAAPIDTTSWKTYSSITYHFSFRYPSDWKITEGENNNPYNIQVFSAGSGYDGNLGSIIFWPDNARAPQTEITYTKSTVTYGGVTATQSDAIDKATGKPAYRDLVFTSQPSGWGYQHGIYIFPANTDGSYAIQTKILETLQFTN